MKINYELCFVVLLSKKLFMNTAPERMVTVDSSEATLVGSLAINSATNAVCIEAITDYCRKLVPVEGYRPKLRKRYGKNGPPTELRKMHLGLSQNGDVDYMGCDDTNNPGIVAATSLLDQFNLATSGAGFSYHGTTLEAIWLTPDYMSYDFGKFHDDPPFLFTALTLRPIEFWDGSIELDKSQLYVGVGGGRSFVEGIPEDEVQTAKFGDIHHFVRRSLHRQAFGKVREGEEELRIMLRAALR